jgi:precorrin-2 dehydrogenase/sirohydrochlorin ferrochelatase
MTKKPLTRNAQPATETFFFPVSLNLKDKLCVIIGGGKVAQRKAENLIKCKAEVKVISPLAEKRIMQHASEGLLNWYKKKFTDNDLDGAYLVFAATDSNQENRRVVDLCRKKRIFANAVDEPELCDFVVPSVLRRKSLAIAISTNGKSPMFAKKVREDLEKVITEEYGEFLDILGEKRERIKRTVLDGAVRNKLFKLIIYSDIIELLKTDNHEEVNKRIEQCISFLPD